MSTFPLQPRDLRTLPFGVIVTTIRQDVAKPRVTHTDVERSYDQQARDILWRAARRHQEEAVRDMDQTPRPGPVPPAPLLLRGPETTTSFQDHKKF